MFAQIQLSPTDIEFQRVSEFFYKSNPKPQRASLPIRRLQRLFNKTNPQVEIKSISRIQNKALLFLYNKRKGEIASENNGSANEELLFHGARQPGIADKICVSGFDKRFGKAQPGTLWFSTTSAYSMDYVNPADQKMIVALVALGAPQVHSVPLDNRITSTDDVAALPLYIIEVGS